MAGQAICNSCKIQIDLPEGYSRPFIPCPQCKKMATVTTTVRPTGSQEAGPAPARPAASPPPTHSAQPGQSARAPGAPTGGAVGLQKPPAPTLAAGGGDLLPEVMKANKRVAGTPCAVCGKQIVLGEQIHNCPACQSVNHESCWTRSGGCSSPSCGSPHGNSLSSASVASAPALASPPAGTIPCRWCKEPIVRGARKCKHCNEYQSDEDRATQGKEAANIEDETLSTTDWIGIICCPLIGLIQGLVYIGQGKPKGQRLVLYSFISMMVSGILRALGGGR